MNSRNWRLVGHRGYPVKYPENTVPGFVAAVQVGVDAVELDVQISRDGVPIVIHDITLERTTTEDGSLLERDYPALNTISAHYPDKFGREFEPLSLLSLEAVCQTLQTLNTEVFIEIKKESIPHMGREEFLRRVLDASQALGSRRWLISFDFEILEMAKSNTNLRVGWCLDTYTQQEEHLAEQLSPHALIAEPALIGGQMLWSGPWEWFIYDINSREEAEFWAEKGATWIEANDPALLLQIDSGGEP